MFNEHKKQLGGELRQLRDLHDRLRKQAFDPQAGEKIAARYRASWNNYERARDDFRGRVNAIRKKYKELRANEELREALNEFGRRFDQRFELVPTDEFAYMVNWFEEALKSERAGDN